MERRYHLHTNPYIATNPYLHSGSRYSGAKSPGTARSSSSWVLWEPQSPSPPNQNPWCSLLTVLILFLVILGVLAVAGLALYMGALRLEPVQSFLVFDGSMRVTGDRYSSGLSNKSSNFYSEKERRYQTLLQAVFMKSPLGSSVHEVYVTSFANGSLIVFFRIILDRKKIPKPISSIEDTLKSVILQEASSPLSVMNALKIDPKDLVIKRFLEDTRQIFAKEELSTSHPLVAKETELIETQRPHYKSSESSPTPNWPVTVSGEASVKTLPSQLIQGTYTVTNGNTQMTSGKSRPPAGIVVKEEPAVVTPGLVLPARRTTTQRSTTEAPELLFTVKHSPALKQYLSLNKEVSSTATPTTAKNKPTTTPTTTTTTTTTTTKKPPTTITTTTKTELPKLHYSEDPWRPIFPDTERRDFKEKLDFDYGVGEAEVVLDAYADASQPPQSEEQVKVTSRMKSNAHTLPSSFVDEIYYTPPSPQSSTLQQFDEGKSMPELSIVQQFHNLDALLRSYTAKPKTTKQTTEAVSTLLPVRSNVGIRSELRPRPTPQDSTGHFHSTTTETMSTSPESHRRIFLTPDSDLVSIPLQRYFSSTSPASNTQDRLTNLAYVTENLKGLAVVGTDDIDVSSQRAALSSDRRSRTTPTSSRQGRSGPMDDEMKLLLERIFQNLTTTAKNPADNRTHKIDFNVPTSPPFNVNNTHFLNKIAKLQIANITSSADKVSNKAVASASHSQNAAPFRLLTKVYNKAPSKTESKQDISKDSTACGKNSTMLCGSGECLPIHLRCNKLMDCRDGSDETNCTCADFLRNQFHSRKICDGIYDCWDLTDEQNCDWCSPGQHICANSKMCVDTSQVCDGFPHCPYGDDEKNCITVAPTLADANEKDYFPTGYVMVRKEGEWGKMCLQNFDNLISKSKTQWSLEDLGQSVCRSLTYKNFDGILRKKEISPRSEVGSPVYYELKLSSEKNNESQNRRSSSDKFTFQKTTCIEKEVAEVLCSDLECGIRPEASVPWANERRSRIVGGGNAGPGAWPWQAALYKEGEFQCGATLISDTWLLSAGHCFYNAQKDYWVARLGALRRGTPPAPFEQLRPIAQVVLHPEYQDQGFINDISLLRMTRPVTFTTYVRPICLPTADREPRDGAMCTVVGWGQLYEVARVFPDTLQEVQLPIISTSECRKRTLFLPLYKVTDNMFCAGYERGGRDACLGDSGGPLMCQENDGRWTLTGVTSNGYGCARANRPGVYTKVVNYLPWVETTIASPLASDVGPADCVGHRCPLGECLPPARLCNGYIECRDSSDERGCW